MSATHETGSTQENPPALSQVGRSWIVRIGAIAALVVVLGIAAPLVVSAAVAGAGLVALGITGLAAFAMIQALPWLGQRLENRLLAARRKEARRNPIEQMQNELLRRSEQIRSFRTALAGVQAQIEGLQDMLDTRRQQTPGHDLRKPESVLARMRSVYASHVDRLACAESALQDFDKHVAAKRFEYQCALELEQINHALHGSDSTRMLEQMLADEATQAVQQRFNQAFAALELDHQLIVQNRSAVKPDFELVGQADWPTAHNVARRQP